MSFGAGAFGAGAFGAVDVPVEPLSIESNGGYRIDLLVDGLADGDYTVYVGPLGNALDPACFVYLYLEGGDRHGTLAKAVDGALVVYSPVLPVGGPYRFTLVPTAGGTVTTLPVLTVERYWYRSRTFTIRRWLPGHWGVGARRLRGVPLQP